MSLEHRLESLRSKHATVDVALKQESLRPLPDPEALARMKREKLRLKDEISRLTN